MVSSGSAMDPEQVVRRNPPGTKAEDFYKWSPQSFDEMDSTLAVQQYIQQTIRQDFTDTETILTAPPGQDEGVWKYEQLRQFCLELNGLAIKLQAECTPMTCSQMTATEQWIFLCAAHKTPKECPAIDYTRHTLDGAACLLNSNKYFPSRVSIKDSSVAKLGSVCRRVYRIFSHAYYHHRHIFDESENETYLCRRFTTFVIRYNLMSRDNLIVPIMDDMAPNTSNNNSVEQFTIVKNMSGDSAPKTIACFQDLPEGVIPDPDDNEDDFGGSPVDPEDGGTEIEDGFSYSDDVNFGTLKPMKGTSLSEMIRQSEEEEEQKSDAVDESLNITVVPSENNEESDPDPTEENAGKHPDENQV
ncbi:MOB-like protein phocein [Ciona intestinalis]